MRKLINSKFMPEEYIDFVEDIINGMKDWVRVIDLKDNIVYANKAMKEALNKKIEGKKCYEVIGRDTPCENCVSKKAFNNLEAMHKEEIIDGKIFSVMSSAMRNKSGEVAFIVEVLRDVTQDKLMDEKIKAQNNKFNKDLQISRKMQYNLLPRKIINNKIKFDYLYKPSEMIGGDFFDIFDIDETHVGLYVADVSGHGVPASLITMFLRQTIKKDELSPSKVLEQLYKKYRKANFDYEQYITMFYSIINTEKGTIKYANAGHHAIPLYLSKSAGEITPLEARGVPISRWLDEVEYEEHMIEFKTTDIVLYYTDGIIENINAKGEMYGVERLQKILAGGLAKELGEIKNSLVNDIVLFSGGDIKNDETEDLEKIKLNDDITAILVKIKQNELE